MEFPPLLKLQESYEHENWGGEYLGKALFRSMFLKGQASSSIEFSTSPFTELKIMEGPFLGTKASKLIEDHPDAFLGKTALDHLGENLSFEVRFLGADSSQTPVYIIEPEIKEGTKKKYGPKPSAGIVIVEASPNSKIYYGKRRNLDDKKFASLLRMSPDLDVLQEYSANPGQAFVIPPGLPFSLGEGILAYCMCIHSQSSPSLKKLEAGKSTVKKGGDTVTSVTLPPKKLFIDQRGWIEDQNALCWLLASGGAALTRLDLRSEWTLKNSGSFSVLTCLSGSALLNADGELETAQHGSSVIVTASCKEVRINPGPQGAVIYRSWFPDFVDEMEKELVVKGFSAREINGLFGFFGKEGI